MSNIRYFWVNNIHFNMSKLIVVIKQEGTVERIYEGNSIKKAREIIAKHKFDNKIEGIEYLIKISAKE